MRKIGLWIIGSCISALLLFVPFVFIKPALMEGVDPRFIIIIGISSLWIACDMCVPDKDVAYHNSVKYHLTDYDYFGYASGIFIYFYFLSCLKDLFSLTPVTMNLLPVGTGIYISLTGLLIRLSSILTLGHFFTEQLKVLTFQPLIKSGIYHWIRHPSYLGLLIILLGVTLITQSIWGLIYYFTIIWPMVLIRASHEEKAMRIGFGADYDEYCQQTKKLIPFVF